MTKPLVTVGALQLIEAGGLGLDDEVASIVPGYGELLSPASRARCSPQIIPMFDEAMPEILAAFEGTLYAGL